MVQQLLNQMQISSARAIGNLGFIRLGIVDSYNPDTYAVKVRLQPDDELLETGFTATMTPWAGSQWGFFAPPVPGTQVVVGFVEGNRQEPIILGCLYSDEMQPLPVTAGEFWIVHQSGSLMKLTNDGKVNVNGQAEIDMTAPKVQITTTGDTTLAVGGNLSATVTGDANITAIGDATLKGSNVDVTGNSVTLGDGTSMTDALVKLNGLIAWANTHVHSDPQGGNTGVADPALTTAVGTTVIRGS